MDGIEGRLGIVKLSDLDPTTNVYVLQEKPGAPLSYSARAETLDSMPMTDFATVIVGRSPGGTDAVWTIHPGAPIRPIGPGEDERFKHGDVVTVQDLYDVGETPDSHIKLLPPEKVG